MTSLPFDFEVAERHRTLFLLDAKISAARTELGRLVHANERRVLSALGARADAQAMSQPVGEDHEEVLSVGIGIALYPQDALTGAELVDCADRAMYRAKAHGGSRGASYDANAFDHARSAPSGSDESLADGVVPTEHPQPARLADLREANEHLVLAALTAQGLQTKAEGIHLRQAMFLAMVAHELRNPLNPIRMATELLQHAHANEGLILQVQGILSRQVAHLSRLVDDLLDGARASTGKFQLECGRVALREVLDPVIDAARPAMLQRQQTIVSHLTSERAMVHGDPLRLAQVFSNLLDNASKYTQRGGQIGVELSCTAGLATLSVSDNGIGISAEALPRIFDLFAQEPHARAHDGQGLGLGLAIVRELVEAHGGTIVAGSAGRDLGSQFVLVLPLLLDERNALPVTAGAPAQDRTAVHSVR